MRASAPGFAFSVNHMFPSGPGVIIQGARSGGEALAYSLMSPFVVMRPMRPGLRGLGEPERAVGPVRDSGRPRVRGQALVELA